MTDRVHSSAKPNGTAPTSAAAATNGPTNPPPFQATKSQLYNPTRHPYRPQPNRHRHRRRRPRVSCCRCLCLCCFWSFILLTTLLLLAAIAGAAVYVLYRPHRPTFTVSALRISRFNLSTTSDDITHLTTLLNLTLSTKNPNKKLSFLYDPLTITTISISNQVLIGNGSFPSFNSNPGNITFIRSSLSTVSQVLDAESVKSLRSDLKKKTNGLSLKIMMDTMVVVKMEGLKSKKVGIRVSCEGIHGQPPKGKSPSVASTSDAECKVDLRITIWKWSF